MFTPDELANYLTERELSILANCINYATNTPGGLPGHNLMILVWKLASAMGISRALINQALEIHDLPLIDRQEERYANKCTVDNCNCDVCAEERLPFDEDVECDCCEEEEANWYSVPIVPKGTDFNAEIPMVSNTTNIDITVKVDDSEVEELSKKLVNAGEVIEEVLSTVGFCSCSYCQWLRKNAS